MTCGRGSRRKLGYQAHYVVDGGKARVVLDALVAPAEVTENRPVLDLLWHTCFRWKIRPHHVTADGKYGTLENIAALEEAGVRAYVALHESGSKPGSFPKGDFRYDPARDVYSCPAGKLLHLLPGEGLRMCGLPAQEPMHLEQERATASSRSEGTLCRAGSGLPRHGTLREGPAKEEGVGRASLRRS
jgi:Transposase DDE domain